jgi:hypothetical protein
MAPQSVARNLLYAPKSREPRDIIAPDVQLKSKINKLTLDAERVSKIEEDRFAKNPPNAPWFIRGPYHILCWMLDAAVLGT